MDEDRNPMIAVCGLDCEGCDIRTFPHDPEAAERIVAWYRKMGWLKENEGAADAVRKSMLCQGCRGDRRKHWSADCWILLCCVDEKHLESCHDCDTFPCERLREWGKENADYAKALARLQDMRGKERGE
ncbi:MAG: DUF3795 domain-containing protein [Planctomycetota bacterium]|jgi:hypothetical protein